MPTGNKRFNESSSSPKEFYDQWNRMPNGSVIYHLVAHANPEDVAGTEIGEISVSECTTSTFGDEMLFFQHQRIEEDIKLNPSWKNAYMKD